MNMQNATAAGPSRGLLDVLFGSGKSAEEAEAGGQGFESLMNFIKTMNGEKKEDQSAVLSRTLQETMRGKGVVEDNAAGTPGMNAASEVQAQLAQVPVREDKEKKEKLTELSQLLGLPVQQVPQRVQEPIPGLKPEQVNAVLKQNAQKPLTKEELKLLQAVNSKLDQVQAPKVPELPKPMAAGAAAIAADQAPDPRLHKEMAKKGIDPSKLKVAETSVPSGSPEKMVSTETYLQMHESMGKAPAKEAVGKGANAALAEGSPSQVAAQGSLTSAAIAGTESKGLELGSRKDRKIEVPEGTKQAPKLDSAGAAIALTQGSKEISQHEVNLSGLDKPDQMRQALLGEVAPGVTQHALKGGGEMRLVVTPEDMGEVKLKVSTKNGKVEVSVTAENNDVAQILRGGSRDLEASLKEQNLSLSKFEVSVVADPTSVSSLEAKSSLNEQFLSQNQQQQHGGFGQGSDDGRNSRWGSGENGRQGATYATVAEENGRNSPASARAVPRQQAARSSSGRLDVVA